MIPQCQEDINFRVSEAKLLLPKLSQHQRPLQLKLMLPQKREQHQNKKNHKQTQKHPIKLKPILSKLLEPLLPNNNQKNEQVIQRSQLPNQNIRIKLETNKIM